MSSLSLEQQVLAAVSASALLLGDPITTLQLALAVAALIWLANRQPKPSSTNVFQFSSLSPPLRRQVLSFLLRAEIAQCTSVSRQWHSFSLDDLLWNALYRRDLQSQPASATSAVAATTTTPAVLDSAITAAGSSKPGATAETAQTRSADPQLATEQSSAPALLPQKSLPPLLPQKSLPPPPPLTAADYQKELIRRKPVRPVWKLKHGDAKVPEPPGIPWSQQYWFSLTRSLLLLVLWHVMGFGLLVMFRRWALIVLLFDTAWFLGETAIHRHWTLTIFADAVSDYMSEIQQTALRLSIILADFLLDGTPYIWWFFGGQRDLRTFLAWLSLLALAPAFGLARTRRNRLLLIALLLAIFVLLPSSISVLLQSLLRVVRLALLGFWAGISRHQFLCQFPHRHYRQKYFIFAMTAGPAALLWDLFRAASLDSVVGSDLEGSHAAATLDLVRALPASLHTLCWASVLVLATWPLSASHFHALLALPQRVLRFLTGSTVPNRPAPATRQLGWRTQLSTRLDRAIRWLESIATAILLGIVRLSLRLDVGERRRWTAFALAAIALSSDMLLLFGRRFNVHVQAYM